MTGIVWDARTRARNALDKARHVVEEVLGLKLQTGWDKPPIHHTDANCWTCGQFTPGPSITGVDRAAGWEAHVGGAVTCSPECKRKLDRAASVNHAKRPKKP